MHNMTPGDPRPPVDTAKNDIKMRRTHLSLAPGTYPVAPFYCLQQLVYHTHKDCPQARLISLINQRRGTGSKVVCLCCRRLTKQAIKKELVTRVTFEKRRP